MALAADRSCSAPSHRGQRQPTRGRNRLPLKTLPLRRKHDIKQALPDRLQAGAHLVGLIRGNLGKGVVDPVDETLGARFIDLELRLEVALDVQRPQREIGSTAAAAAPGLSVAACQTRRARSRRSPEQPRPQAIIRMQGKEQTWLDSLTASELTADADKPML
jgi:hypothetical protein